MHGCAVWKINNYEQAVSFYNRCEPVKRNNPTVRKIRGKETSRVMNVRLDDGVVRFRYHDTDVVSWFPDNTYMLDLTYESRSTQEFSYHFIPNRHYVLSLGREIQVNGWLYPTLNKTVKVTADGVVTPTGFKYVKWFINRERAKEVLSKTKYRKYQRWYNTIWPVVRESITRKCVYSLNDALNLLADETKWYDLMESYCGMPDTIREYIYTENNVYDRVEVDRLPANNKKHNWTIE
jgi:hypothetical protein